MKKIDITREIQKMHIDTLLHNAVSEVIFELKDEIPLELQAEIDQLITKANQFEEDDFSSVLLFEKKKSQKKLYTFAQTELLAASSKSLSNWFSQPMNFTGAGFVLDVRKVLATENEVDVYLTANKNNAEMMQDSLSSYLGQSVQIIVSNNDNVLLEADLYIDEVGTAAEGSGKLIKQPTAAVIKGELSISIVINMKDNG